MTRTSSGFTLVELAIALMVIGLLIGGVLKGQELIENARVTATIRQLKSYDAAVMIFRNTYGALPGDIKKPTRIPNCTEAVCNMPGNGDGKFSGYPNEQENYNFFPHLTKAGMIQGPEGGNATEMADSNGYDYNDAATKFFPETPIGNLHWIETGTSISSTEKTYYYFKGKTRSASQLDGKMDDEKPYSGDIRVESCDTVDSGSDGNPADYTYGTDETHPCDLWVTLNI